MSSPRTVFLAVVLAVLLLSCGAATAATFDRSVTVFSAAGEPIAKGERHAYHDGNAEITGGADAGGGILEVRPHDGSGWRRSHWLSFRPARDRIFEVGTFERAVRDFPPYDERNSMWITNEHTACNAIDGSFEVKEIAYRPGGGLARLWMLYEQRCEGRPPTLWGEVLIGMPDAPGGAAVASRLVRWPENEVGRRFLSVPVELSAKQATTIASATLAGDGASSVEVVEDGCSGRALAVGESCAVWVRPLPFAAAGELAATLTLTEAGGAAHAVELSAVAHGTTTEVELLGDPDDWPSQGGSWTRRSDDSVIYAQSPASWSQSLLFTFGSTESNVRWRGLFQAPAGEVLAPGTYDGALLPAEDSARPGMRVWNSYVCNAVTGRFTVHELRRDLFGELSAAHVTFEQHCEGARAALRGSLRFRASDGTAWMPAPVGGPVEEQPEPEPRTPGPVLTTPDPEVSAPQPESPGPSATDDAPAARVDSPADVPALPLGPGAAAGRTTVALGSLAISSRGRLSFVAGEAGRLHVTIVRRSDGVRRAGRCLGRAPRRGERRCTRSAVTGRASAAVAAGRGAISLRLPAAAAGTVVVSAQLVAAHGRRSATRTIHVR